MARWGSSVRGGFSFADFVGNRKHRDLEDIDVLPVLKFCSPVEQRRRMEKAYIVKVVIPGSAYNIQTNFEVEGVFVVKISLLEANLYLLEEREKGFLDDLIGNDNVWWKQWFS